MRTSRERRVGYDSEGFSDMLGMVQAGLRRRLWQRDGLGGIITQEYMGGCARYLFGFILFGLGGL